MKASGSAPPCCADPHHPGERLRKCTTLLRRHPVFLNSSSESARPCAADPPTS